MVSTWLTKLDGFQRLKYASALDLVVKLGDGVAAGLDIQPWRSTRGALAEKSWEHLRDGKYLGFRSLIRVDGIGLTTTDTFPCYAL